MNDNRPNHPDEPIERIYRELHDLYDEEIEIQDRDAMGIALAGSTTRNDTLAAPSAVRIFGSCSGCRVNWSSCRIESWPRSGDIRRFT
jgi:hypothetical protein